MEPHLLSPQIPLSNEDIPTHSNKVVMAASSNCICVFDGLSAGQKYLPSGTTRGGGHAGAPPAASHPNLRTPRLSGGQHKPCCSKKKTKTKPKTKPTHK